MIHQVGAKNMSPRRLASCLEFKSQDSHTATLGVRKMKLVLVSILMGSLNVHAGSGAARIIAQKDGQAVQISLKANGEPEESGARYAPTIKDFEESSDFESFCVEGDEPHVRRLLEALVLAADGDGDSFAEFEAIERRGDGYQVRAIIVRGSGDYEENLEILFPHCR